MNYLSKYSELLIQTKNETYAVEKCVYSLLIQHFFIEFVAYSFGIKYEIGLILHLIYSFDVDAEHTYNLIHYHLNVRSQNAQINTKTNETLGAYAKIYFLQLPLSTIYCVNQCSTNT